MSQFCDKITATINIHYNTDSIWLSSFDFPFSPDAFMAGGCSDDGEGAVILILGTKWEKLDKENF